MLTIWGRATSSNVQKVMWTVGELGLDHERIDVGGHHGGLDTDEYRALNPHGLIPTVRFADGRVMWESNAIVRTLALADPERRLWPERLGGAPDMWAEWANGAVSRPIIDLFWAVVRTHPSRRDPERIAALHAASVKALETAAAQLHAGFLASDTLTIADINFGHLLYRWFTMEVDRPAMPAVDDYYTRLTERPAYAAQVMMDYASLRPAA